MSHSFAAPFETYVAPARAAPEIWRIIAGICIIAATFGSFAFALFWCVDRFFADFGGLNPSVGTLFAFLATFIGMAAGPMVAVRFLHARSTGSLFGRAPWVLADFVWSVVIVAIIFVISIATWSIWFDARPNLDLSTWLVFLPFTLIGLLIQTGAEELVFRGYLQQQLSARFASPVAWAVLPSALFGLLHYDPINTGGNVWFIVAATGLFGLLAADITARTGSIGAAWGFHFANNVFALLILSVDGPLTGLALYVTPYEADAPILRQLIFIDIATICVAWILLRRILRR